MESPRGLHNLGSTIREKLKIKNLKISMLDLIELKRLNNSFIFTYFHNQCRRFLECQRELKFNQCIKFSS